MPFFGGGGSYLPLSHVFSGGVNTVSGVPLEATFDIDSAFDNALGVVFNAGSKIFTLPAGYRYFTISTVVNIVNTATGNGDNGVGIREIRGLQDFTFEYGAVAIASPSYAKCHISTVYIPPNNLGGNWGSVLFYQNSGVNMSANFYYFTFVGYP